MQNIPQYSIHLHMEDDFSMDIPLEDVQEKRDSIHSIKSSNLEDHFSSIQVHHSYPRLDLETSDAFSNETSLINYTDHHFIHRLNEDLEKIRNIANIPSSSSSSSSSSGNFYDQSNAKHLYHNHNYSRNSPLTLSKEPSENNSDIDYDHANSDYDHANSDDSGHGRNNRSVYANDPAKQMTASSLSFYGMSGRKAKQFRNLTYQEIEKSLDKYYDEPDAKYSNKLDIMITYLKGQKNLHIQSKNSSHSKLNILFVPSLVITAAITIFAPFIQSYDWSGGVISGLNALITMLILIANYYKLESAVEFFFHTANQFDKLETSLEFVASKMLFIQDDSEKSKIVLEKIQEMEKKISEIKEWNTLFIPEEVRRMFPIICNINIFSFIKRMEAYKRSLVIKFKDIKNEIRYIMYHFAKMQNKSFVDISGSSNYVGGIQDIDNEMEMNTQVFSSGNDNIDMFSRLDEDRYNKRLLFLLDIKEKIKEELIYYRNAYNYIDELFTKEIKHAQRYNQCTWIDMACNQSAFKHDPISNPVVDRYLHYLFYP